MCPFTHFVNGTFLGVSQGMQDALQGALSSVLQLSPHRRVALVTFNDEVQGVTPPI